MIKSTYEAMNKVDKTHKRIKRWFNKYILVMFVVLFFANWISATAMNKNNYK